MKTSLRLRNEMIRLSLLILIAIVAWQLLHRTPPISSEVYPYLCSLSPALVKKCMQENRTSPIIPWDDLLAIRSTLSEKDAQPLIEQLHGHVLFSNLNWASLPTNTLRTVQRHREILKRYPYYQPNKYSFPVLGTTWFEDSFGADREGGIRRHEGTDLFGKEGTPIVSICGGKSRAIRVEPTGWRTCWCTR